MGGLKAVDPDMGTPKDRKPRTAILNMVAYHTEVVTSLVYHFVKMRHDVTVYARDDDLNMQAVIDPWFWRGFRKFERFFEAYHTFDTIVFVTFPTCHHPVLATLASLRVRSKKDCRRSA